MPLKQGKTSKHHNWPRYMDFPQIGPKSAIKLGKNAKKTNGTHFARPRGWRGCHAFEQSGRIIVQKDARSSTVRRLKKTECERVHGCFRSCAGRTSKLMAGFYTEPALRPSQTWQTEGVSRRASAGRMGGMWGGLFLGGGRGCKISTQQSFENTSASEFISQEFRFPICVSVGVIWAYTAVLSLSDRGPISSKARGAKIWDLAPALFKVPTVASAHECQGK